MINLLMRSAAAATVSFAMGLAGCSDVGEAPATNSRLPTFVDLPDSPPVEMSGAVWRGGTAVTAYLDPVRQADSRWTIEAIAPLGEASGEVNGQRTVALTNTFELDCNGQRYRKTAETYLSSEARPLRRATFASPAWQSGLYPVFQWVCGEQSLAVNATRFSSMRELLEVYERTGVKIEWRASAPTIIPPKEK
ncbi:hypothetical protein [Brevundimonas sp.]|uniref:hypothetical protein n=1 Tax=Brevundimonas sp. TaxID=1871086 RepID=UPI003F6E4B52